MSQRRSAWQAAATELGLQVVPSLFASRRMAGNVGGMEVEVKAYASDDGGSRQYWTRYRATFPRRGAGIRLKRQTGLSRITKFFGATDVEIGDQIFDDAFVIKARSEEHAKEYLTLDRRNLILRLFASYREVNLTEDHVEVLTRGYERSTARLITNTRRIISAARSLGGYVDTSSVERSLRRRLTGDLEAAVEVLEPAVDPADIEAPLLEAEILTSSGRLKDARPVLDELAARLPTDAEVSGLRRAVDRMAAQEPGDAAAPPGEPVDLEELLEELFVSNRLSFETAEIFDKHYRGRRVAWKGRIQSVRAYNSDLDFGRGPGVKVVVALAEIEHDLYGIAEVDAVVSLPPGSETGLDRNDLISFAGTLHRADSMMRNVFVADATLT